MKTIQKLQRYIENTPWDEWLDENDRYFERGCIIFIILVWIYIGFFTIIGF